MNYMNMYEKMMEQKRITYLTPVLVRDTDQDLWEVDIFITRDMKDEYSYHCKWNVWKQCIPLKGNLAFLGSNKKHY